MRRPDDPDDVPLRVLRVYHAGVVAEWRRREDELRALGVDVVLVSASAWNEGGATVRLDAGDDTDLVSARTIGRHPYRFVYDPRPIWRALRRTRPDVLDVHEEPASLAVAEVLLLAWLARCPAPVCLFSAQNIEKRYPVPFRWLEHLALRRARGVATCNDEAGRILARKGFRGESRNLGLGVDTDHFSPGQAHRPAAGCVVGFVGRLEPHKGLHVLLDALARSPRLTLRIVGAGSEDVGLRREVDARGLSDRVELLGFTPPEALPDVYRGLDLLAVPSLDTPAWIEQFGRVAVEAMACGVPVVASRSGALPEVLAGAGVLVPAGDAGALADALCRLAGDADARRRLSAAGLERAAHFSWAQVAARQLALYRDLRR